MTRISPERLEEILERARSLRIAVIGDLMLDIYLSGKVGRISPEAPVPVVQVTEERVALGGAGNVAANVVALGARCALLGCVGEDAAALQLRMALAGLGEGAIEPVLITRPERPTTTKTRVLAPRQQVVRFDRERDDDLPGDCAHELCERIEQLIGDADVLVLEDYNKGLLTPPVIRFALAAARGLQIPSVVDPKFRHFFAYGGATVFKPNLAELVAAFGMPLQVEEGPLREARRRLGCMHLLVTLGEEGMVLCSGESPPLRIPALAREVYDVSGAGDTVTACVAVALGTGASIEEAAVLANLAAAIEVGKPGVATVTPPELGALIGELMPLQGADFTLS